MFMNTYLPTRINREINRAMNQTCDQHAPMFTHQIRSEVVDRGERWEVVLDLPGLDREDVEIFVEDEMLVIKGARNREALAEGDRLLQSTRLYGTFERRYRLSDEIDGAGIEALMEKGVLHVKLPKAEKALPKRVDIKIN